MPGSGIVSAAFLAQLRQRAPRSFRFPSSQRQGRAQCSHERPGVAKPMSKNRLTPGSSPVGTALGGDAAITVLWRRFNEKRALVDCAKVLF